MIDDATVQAGERASERANSVPEAHRELRLRSEQEWWSFRKKEKIQ